MTSEHGDGADDQSFISPDGRTPLGRHEHGRGSPEEWTERYDMSLPADGGLEAAVQKMDAVSEEYEDDGWDVYKCHPGGVNLLADDGRTGVKILVPDNELDDVEDLLREGSYDAYQVYREEYERLLFFVVAVEDGSERSAILYAGYFDLDEAAPMFERADRDGTLAVYLHTGGGDYVEFAPLDPAFFRPADGDDRESGDESADASGR